MSRALSRPHPAGRSHDVIVVGAGVAGAATALLLAQRDVATLLLERDAGADDGISAEALLRGGVLQVARWGLLDDIAVATPAVTRTAFRYGDEEVVVNLRRSHGTHALYVPRRALLERVLLGAAVAAGADVRHGTVVTDVIRRHGRVVGVEVVTADGGAGEQAAELVIGADGVRSAVARGSGAAVARQGRHAGAMTFAHWSDLDVDGYEWTFRANACSGVVPIDEREACVFASARPERIGRGGVEVLREIVAEGNPALAARLAATRPSTCCARKAPRRARAIWVDHAPHDRSNEWLANGSWRCSTTASPMPTPPAPSRQLVRDTCRIRRSSASVRGRAASVDDDAADVFAGVHVLVALGDLIQAVGGGDQLVQLDLAVPVHLGLPQNVRAGIGRPEEGPLDPLLKQGQLARAPPGSRPRRMLPTPVTTTVPALRMAAKA